MLGLARIVKDLVVAPSPSAAPPASRGAGFRALARVALSPAAAIPRALAGLPDLMRTLADRSAEIPADRRKSPNASWALKALSGIMRTDGQVRDSYLSLLTATMDRAVADELHPAFLDLLGQTCSDELRMLATMAASGPSPLVTLSSRLRHGGASRVELRHFSVLGERAGCAHAERTPAYIDNLTRLGLIEVRPARVTDDVRMFEELETHPIVQAARARIEQQPPVRIGPISEAIVADLQYKLAFVTAFGSQFRAACFFRPSAGSELVEATA